MRLGLIGQGHAGATPQLLPAADRSIEADVFILTLPAVIVN